jgi:hAT family C-terminal dimerisation region
MVKLVLSALEFYNLKDKLFCITTDNATNNDTMARELSELLLQEDGIYWENDTHHLYCLAHIINLVVKKLMDSLVTDDDNPFKVTLTKIQELAKAAQRGSKKPASFRTACKEAGVKPLRIPLDVDVRWNSTYRMLEVAVYLRPALMKFIGLHIDDLNQYRPSDNEWMIAEQVLMILMPFQRCTARFECNSRSSEVDYVFFAYDTMFNHLEDVQSSLRRSKSHSARFLISAIDDALGVLRTYYDKTSTLPFIYADAMILNPRIKLSIFNLESWGDEDANYYKAQTRDRFVQNYIDERVQESDSPSQCPRDSQANTEVHDDDDYLQHVRKRLKTANERECEFDTYIANPYGDPDICDPLAWWRENESNYPRLSRMARDYLAVPPSGCAVEREFSVSGRIATWQRNRLSTERICASMMYKSAMRREQTDTKRAVHGDTSDWVDIDDEEEQEASIPREWSDNWWKQRSTRK